MSTPGSLPRMQPPDHRSLSILRLFGLIFPLLLLAASANAAWERSDTSIAWKTGNETLWLFSWSKADTKPWFHPLRLHGGEPLTGFRPADHPWHYGLWFSWKFINGVNYWEEDKITKHSAGTTTWDPPELSLHDDGSATLRMSLRYLAPGANATVLMTERRRIGVSAPGPDGGVTIDWTGNFSAGAKELLLDRTPIPGEPGGVAYGGYAGLSFRLAGGESDARFITAEGPVQTFEKGRNRPRSKAAACNLSYGGRTDGVAILSHASNTGGDSPWYLINSKVMRWFSPVLLATGPKKVAPGESFSWKFRVITKAGGWTQGEIKSASDAYDKRPKRRE